MLSILLDIEWLLSTLFDASLLTFEPPATAAPFFVVSFRVITTWWVAAVPAGGEARPGQVDSLRPFGVEYRKVLISAQASGAEQHVSA